MGKARNPQFFEAIEALNGLGWTDKRIGLAFNRTANVIAYHRSARGIAPAPSKFHAKIDRSAGLRLWGAGVSDGSLAKSLGCTQSGATRWRQRMGLERNFDPVARTDAQVVHEAKKLLRMGATRKTVGSKVGLSTTTLTKIRKSMAPEGLRKTGVTDRDLRTQTLRDTSLLDRIAEAIGPRLPRDVRQDAIDELYLAVLSGEVPVARIGEVAAKYRSAAYALNYGDYASVSLNEDRGGWCLEDNLVDPEALHAMEQFANDD